MREFRYLRGREVLVVGDDEVDEDDAGFWFAPIETVSTASLASLRRSVTNYAQFWGSNASGYDSVTNLREATATLHVSPASVADFDVDYSERHNVALSVLPNGDSTIDIEVPIYGIDLDEDEFAPVLAPLLSRLRASLLEVVLHAVGNQGVCLLRVGYDQRGATVGDALAIGDSVAALISQLRNGELTADAALGLLRASRGDLLVGLPESRWLEVKSQGYDLGAGDAPKIELAQDVARFANGETDSLLIIGFRTDKRHGDEVISKMTPSLTKFAASRYHQTIDARVHPNVLGLDVQQFDVSLRTGATGYLLAILVPSQPPESKPFLVSGAVIGDKVEGAFISIVQRRGEHSVPITAPAIHAALAAGQALLRRGELPSPGPVAVPEGVSRTEPSGREQSLERLSRKRRRSTRS